MNWNRVYKIYENRRFSDCLLLLFLCMVDMKKIRRPHSWRVGIELRMPQLCTCMSSILRHTCLHIQYKNWSGIIPLMHSWVSILNYDSLQWSAIDRGQINSGKVCGWGRISDWVIWCQFKFYVKQAPRYTHWLFNLPVLTSVHSHQNTQCHG